MNNFLINFFNAKRIKDKKTTNKNHIEEDENEYDEKKNKKKKSKLCNLSQHQQTDLNLNLIDRVS